MYRGASVAVVIPAYEEQRHLPGTLASIPAIVDRVFVVDDGSSDRTSEIALKAPGVTLIRHETNVGVGGAIASGYERARALKIDITVVVGADGQMHPEDMTSLIDPLIEGRADYAKGDRLAWPGALKLMPLPRYVGNHALSWLTRRVTGTRVSDSQCGYSAISLSALRRLELGTLWPRYGYPNDLLSRFAHAGIDVEDVPVRPIYGTETSGVSVLDAVVVVPFVLAKGALRRQAAERVARS